MPPHARPPARHLTPPPASPQQSEALALLRSLDRRERRDAHNHFRLDGVRQLVQASDAGLDIDLVLTSDRLLTSPVARMIVRRLGRSGTRRVNLPPELFRTLCREERASGVIALARQPWRTLDDIAPPPGRTWVCVESVRSPGNLGTLLRTAAATDAAGLIVVSSNVDPFDPSVVRAAMGGLAHLTIARATPTQLAAWAAHHGGGLVALTAGAPPLWTAPLPPPAGPCVLLLGDERTGLSLSLRSVATHAAGLPMPGHADSLNLGVAGSVALYELLRRRGTSPVPTVAPPR